MSYFSTAIKKARYLLDRDDGQILVLEKNNGGFLNIALDTPASRDAAITTAVNNLLAGVPGALDTLNELATALGDDANFAATVTTALGTRLKWRGAWAATTAYAINDLVMFNGGLYLAPTSFTSGASFIKANWTELLPQIGTYALLTQAKKATLQPLVSVATRGASYNQGWSNGTVTSGTARVQHKATATAKGLRLVFGNVGGQNGAQADGANPITVRASIEDASGRIWRVTFNGQRSVIIDPGAIVVSDPVGAALTVGDTFYTRTYVSVSSGQSWTLGITANGGGTSGEGNTYGTPGTDLTASGTVTVSFSFVYSPMAVVAGDPNLATPTVVLVGDSIISGQGDSPAHDLGFLVRALNGTYGYIEVSQPGEKASQFVVIANSEGRYQLASRFGTTGFEFYGANDLANGDSLATIQANRLSIWKELSVRGLRVVTATNLPRTTTTDAWATLGNQTAAASESVRIALNGWLRGGAPIDPTTKAAVAVGTTGALTCDVYDATPAKVLTGTGGHYLTAVTETADAVESSRNSGKWKVTGSANGWTPDGVHPNSTGHAAMATAVPTSLIA